MQRPAVMLCSETEALFTPISDDFPVPLLACLLHTQHQQPFEIKKMNSESTHTPDLGRRDSQLAKVWTYTVL